METVLRIVVVYLFVLVALRILGKREFNQLSAFDLVTLLLIPEIVSQALTHNDYSMTNALVGISTLFCLVFATSWLVHRSPRAERVIQGTLTVLAHRGVFLEDALNRERVTADDVMAAARQQGLERPEQIRWAVLESDGQISVVPERSA